MEYRIILEKEKLIVRFRKKRGEINKSVICHTRDALSLFYGRPEVIEYTKNKHVEHIDIILTVPNKQNIEGREILGNAQHFLDNFFFSYSMSLYDCGECITKKRPSFCTYKNYSQ